MSSNDLNTRIRLNALRLLSELRMTQAAVVRRAVARGHTFDRQRFNHILRGRESAVGKANAIADGFGVDVSTLTMPVPGDFRDPQVPR